MAIVCFWSVGCRILRKAHLPFNSSRHRSLGAGTGTSQWCGRKRKETVTSQRYLSSWQELPELPELRELVSCRFKRMCV